MSDKPPKLKSKKTTRKEVYDVMRDVLGRNLTVSEQDKVRTAINSCIDSFIGHKEWNLTPRTHHLICSECAAKKTVAGQKEIKNAYRGKRRGFVAD